VIPIKGREMAHDGLESASAAACWAGQRKWAAGSAFLPDCPYFNDMAETLAGAPERYWGWRASAELGEMKKNFREGKVCGLKFESLAASRNSRWILIEFPFRPERIQFVARAAWLAELVTDVELSPTTICIAAHSASSRRSQAGLD
jgi:hypothetical protein